MVLSKDKLICKNCRKEYVYNRSYDKHISTCNKFHSNICKSSKGLKSLGKNKLDLITVNSSKYGTWLDSFGFSYDYWVDNSKQHDKNEINFNVHTYHNHLYDSSKSSIFSKVDSFHEILDSGQFDILFINESKLNIDIPDSHISHSKYKCYRRDRDYLIHKNTDKHGGA